MTNNIKSLLFATSLILSTSAAFAKTQATARQNLFHVSVQLGSEFVSTVLDKADIKGAVPKEVQTDIQVSVLTDDQNQIVAIQIGELDGYYLQTHYSDKTDSEKLEAIVVPIDLFVGRKIEASVSSKSLGHVLKVASIDGRQFSQSGGKLVLEFQSSLLSSGAAASLNAGLNSLKNLFSGNSNSNATVGLMSKLELEVQKTQQGYAANYTAPVTTQNQDESILNTTPEEQSGVIDRIEVSNMTPFGFNATPKIQLNNSQSSAQTLSGIEYKTVSERMSMTKLIVNQVLKAKTLHPLEDESFALTIRAL